LAVSDERHGQPAEPGLSEHFETSLLLLDPKYDRFCDRYRQSYAAILHQWGLNVRRTEVMKFVSVAQTDASEAVGFAPLCPHCRDIASSAAASGGRCCIKATCRARGALLRCVICDVGVRGLCTFCPACGHGGHAEHMSEWFRSSQTCASGCGCHCALEI
jgi:hypothetical protein